LLVIEAFLGAELPEFVSDSGQEALLNCIGRVFRMLIDENSCEFATGISDGAPEDRGCQLER
jgi:hypothetical protein